MPTDGNSRYDRIQSSPMFDRLQSSPMFDRLLYTYYTYDINGQMVPHTGISTSFLQDRYYMDKNNPYNTYNIPD